MQKPSLQKPSSDVSAIAAHQVKNRVARLENAIKTVRNKFYPQVQLPPYHWYRRIVARGAGFQTLFALEQAVRKGDQDLLSRLNEENPKYRKGLSLALSDNFGVAVTSKVQSHLWPLTRVEGQITVCHPVYISGQPSGLFGPSLPQAQLDDLNRSFNGGCLPEFDEEFEKRSNEFFRMIYGGKGHETDLKGGIRERLFNEKSKKKG